MPRRPASFRPLALSLSVVVGLAVLGAAAPAAARKGGSQSIESCAAGKLFAAARGCSQALAAFAQGQEDARLDKVLAGLAKRFDRTERRPLHSGAGCEDATGGADDVGALLSEGAAALADALRDDGPPPPKGGLEWLAHKRDALRTRQQLLGAARLCHDLLKAEGRHLRVRFEDRLREGLGEDREDAEEDFESRWDLLVALFGAGDGPDADEVADALRELVARILHVVAVSPEVSPEWEMIEPAALVSYEGQELAPMCWDGAPWVFFVKRGTVNKLVMYYQGGGACWSHITCNGVEPIVNPTFKQGTGPGDDPGNFPSGFFDLDHPDNPFGDWHQVFVPYCTGDVHWGSAVAEYELLGDTITVAHKGFVNAQVAEKFAREHFVHPDAVFVTGSSAGAYGAIVNSLYLQERAYPSAHFDVVGDAGNGVITDDFLENDLANWGIQENLPPWIPGLNVPLTDLQASDLYVEAAKTYPQNRFATYTTAYDGGQGGQTGFFQVMRSGPNVLFWIRWWDSSCLWNEEMLALNEDAAARTPGNFRYYVGTGSAHTMWGRSKVYTDTTGGVPTIRDWLVSMLAGDAGWTDVVADDFGLLLRGDPRAFLAPLEPFDLAAGRIICD